MICDMCLLKLGEYSEDLDMVICYFCSHQIHFRQKKEAPKFHIPHDKKRSKPRIRKDVSLEV